MFTYPLFFNYDRRSFTHMTMPIIRISIPRCSAKRISIRIYSRGLVGKEERNIGGDACKRKGGVTAMDQDSSIASVGLPTFNNVAIFANSMLRTALIRRSANSQGESESAALEPFTSDTRECLPLSRCRPAS